MEKLTFNPIEGTFDVVDVSVEFYNDLASFPVTGQTNILYVDKSTQKQYLWNGSYVLANVAGLQEVTDVANVTTNNVAVTKPFVGSTQMLGGQLLNTESGTNNSSSLSSLWLQVLNLINGFRTRLLFPVTPTQDNNISLPNASGTMALTSDLPIFLDETSTIADFQTGRTHYYIGEAPVIYDYDLISYPLPVPVQNFNFVNLSVFDVLFASNGGNSTYLLKPNQALRDITIGDNGAWEIYYSEYIDNLYDLQQVTNKGNVTTNAVIVRNNPDTYRTRYSTIGSQIQRDDLGNRIDYTDVGINLNRQTGTKNWRLSLPDITSNTNNSTYTVDFRPNVSGTVAYLSDITAPPPLTNEQIQDSAFAILTDTPTINLNYDDAGNQVTAEVIDNSVDNIKASDMPANSIKSNNTNAVGNPKDIAIPINSSYGRVDELNSGNLTPIPILKLTIQNATLVNGTVTIVDSRITTSTMAIVTAVSGGVLSAVPLTYDVSVAGQITIGNNQIGDNAVITVLMFFN